NEFSGYLIISPSKPTLFRTSLDYFPAPNPELFPRPPCYFRADYQSAFPARANQCWSMDLMSDSLFCGRRFRTLNLVDDFNREASVLPVTRGTRLKYSSCSVLTEQNG